MATAVLTAQDTITAVFVARQSDGRDENTKSVEDQIALGEDYCARQTPPWTLGAVYEERDVSGRRPLERRTGLKQAVADIEAGRAQVLVTAYFDRYVRSIATRGEVVDRVEAAGGQVLTLDFGVDSNATAAQWLNGTFLAMLGEYVARQTGEKTAMSKQRSIDNGIPPFPHITPAYQRREDRTLEPHAVNGPIVREAVQRRLAGDSWRSLAVWMRDAGLVDGDGQPLLMSVDGVETMFRSRLMVGEIHFGDFTPNLAAIADPIMSASTYRRLMAAKAPRGRHAASDRLLARLGVLVCGTCGARMTVDTAKRAGKDYAYYRCGNAHCQRRALVACDVAEADVVAEAKRLARDLVGQASAVDEVEAARLELDQADAALANAIRTLAGLGGEAATREVLDELTAARDKAAARHERLVLTSSRDATATAADWDLMTLDERRAFVSALVEVATVAPGRGPGRIEVTPR